MLKYTELPPEQWKRKARLVAQGNLEESIENWTLQNEGDYWTPVATLHTLRILMHYAATADGRGHG